MTSPSSPILPEGRQSFPLDEVVRQDTGVMLEFSIGRQMTHEDLVAALKAAQEFNADQSVAKGRYLKEQFSDFATVASWVPGFQGSFGTGYPFYANRKDGTVVAIPEISRYIGTVEEKAGREAAASLGNWLCTVCQVENSLTDLKSKCRPCGLSAIKPRDMFKALPDLDCWVVVDEVTPQREAQLQQYLARAGFFSSDPDIYFAIKDTTEVSQAVLNGQTPEKRLPIDLHIVSTQQMHDALKGVEHVATEVYRPGVVTGDESVPIQPRSLHVTWEEADAPYDFMKDFLISFTPRDFRDSKLKVAINRTRNIIEECLSHGDRLELVRTHPKESRQFEEPELQELLKARWESSK